jgi:membrane protease YdiL (CAAX protease family)
MMNMRLRYFVVKREPTTYCGLNLIDTPDVDISVAPVPPARPEPPGRFASAIQVLVCCGQLVTQTPIFALLILVGMKPPAGDLISLRFFAALSLIDTVVISFMIFVFLRASGESVRQVIFGGRPLKKEIMVGLILIPTVLIGMAILMGAMRLVFPGLHNVKISPFDSFTDTPLHAALFVFVVIVAGGFREELARGFLLHRFDQRLGGIWVGQVIYTLAFGAFHYTQGWDAAVAVGVLGFFWGWLYIRRRSVVAAMVSHAGFDALEVLGQLAAKMMGLPTK